MLLRGAGIFFGFISPSPRINTNTERNIMSEAANNVFELKPAEPTLTDDERERRREYRAHHCDWVLDDLPRWTGELLKEIQKIAPEAFIAGGCYGTSPTNSGRHTNDSKRRWRARQTKDAGCLPNMRTITPMPDTSALLEGEMHLDDCDMERCGSCGGQYISCECAEGKRLPFVHYPNLCRRCGQLYPLMFSVTDEEWERYVEPEQRREMLCYECFSQIRKWIDGTETVDTRLEMRERMINYLAKNE
jgi:hypothetical protein